MVDYYSSFGSFIDREKNANLGVSTTGSSFLRKKSGNFRSYMPGADHFGEDLNSLSMNLQLLVRFETSLKLNIIDHNGESMILPEDKSKNEFHYL